MRILLAAFLSAAVAAPVAAGPAEERKQAVEQFKAYIATKKVRNEHNLPFLRLVSGKNKPGKIVDRGRTILLIHGFTDSPYYMKSLGDFFHSQGYDVVGILLPGHGTKPEDLHKVTLKQWQDEVDVGLGYARRLGGEVSIGGFSTGGALALDAVKRHFKIDGCDYGDIYLFSPAIDLPPENVTSVKWGCRGGAATTFIRPWVDDTIPEDSPYGYGKKSTNGLCQLWKVMKSNESNRSEILEGLKGHGVFTIASGADQTVSFDKVEDLNDSLPQGVSGVFDPYDKAQGIEHAAVTRPETNPNYGDMTTKLSKFIENCHANSSPRQIKCLQKFLIGNQKKGG